MATALTLDHTMTSNPLAAPGPDRIVVAGDWHGSVHRAASVIWFAGLREIPIVLQLGDFGYWTPGPWTQRYLDAIEQACVNHTVTLLWLDGNHECFPHLYETPVDPNTGLRTIRDHVHHLPRGLRWRWHGKTWMALGGAHSVDRLMRKEGASWWPEEHLSETDIEHAVTPGPVDVIVSHDVPDGVGIPGLQSHLFPASEIATSEWHRRQVGNVVDTVKPQLLIHGHYHVRYSGRRGSTMCIGLADDGATLVDNTLVLDLAAGRFDD